MKEPVLYTQYKTTVVPALQKEFGFQNIMEVPRVTKVVLNVGYGRHVKDKPFIENVEKTLQTITGQKPVHNKSTKSISNFKIREGMNIGVSVTLRGKAMYDFLFKLIHITFPRVRDFRGITPKAFDTQGNYTIGFKENGAFPEMSTDSVENIHGLEVVIATSATNKKEGNALLTALGFPFKKT
ncbi:MAG: 50S ribosomal protein L5 [Candidatus Magasanikbacteria bacterium CG11_big_fil_rev_8_21_14_0_20_43_7]|uniref:Large ribosomal subunit protein uL5 n=1 Tax=Candidatus Magasanikbacteria bacterium CG11_big_fil_rev_8_21_14_0_20_43_7 TaxID=1974654 RepID=A0A2H0N270_9BACT|nr:MAG: 50S ribosomal protein L5 [Candidatus Magasanikbacteria bacterium CG11_big_fil_rev_8_21_14_0_20_43_7]